jgi:hypothetical protein
VALQTDRHTIREYVDPLDAGDEEREVVVTHFPSVFAEIRDPAAVGPPGDRTEA